MKIDEPQILAAITRYLGIDLSADAKPTNHELTQRREFCFTGGFAWHLLCQRQARITGCMLDRERLNTLQEKIRNSLQYAQGSGDVDLQMRDLQGAQLPSLRAVRTASGWRTHVADIPNLIEFFEAPEHASSPIAVLLGEDCFPTLNPLDLLTHELVFKRIFLNPKSSWAGAALIRTEALIEAYSYDSFLERLALTARWHDRRSPFLGAAAERAEYWTVGWEVLWQLSRIYTDANFNQYIR